MRSGIKPSLPHFLFFYFYSSFSNAVGQRPKRTRLPEAPMPGCPRSGMAIRAKRSVRQGRAFIHERAHAVACFWRSGRRMIAVCDFSEQLVAALLDGFGHAEAVGGQRESVELLEGDAVTQVLLGLGK